LTEDLKQADNSKKKRVYQVAKDFHISNEALIDFLHAQHFKVRNHMAPVTDPMLELLNKHFHKPETEVEKEPDFRKKIQEKRKEEEAHKHAIEQEIREVLELSKGEMPPVEQEAKKTAGKKAGAAASKKKTEPEKGKAEPGKADAADETGAAKPDEGKGKETQPVKPAKLPVIQLPPRGEPGKDKKGAKPTPEKKVPLRVWEVSELEEAEVRDGHRPKKGKKPEPAPVFTAGAGQRRKKKKKRKKTGVKIDEKEIEASIRETLAKMGETGKKKRRKKIVKETGEEIEVVEEENTVQTTEFVTAGELANLMDVQSNEVIKACLSLGLMVSINQRLDKDTILMVADEFGFTVKFLTEYGEEHYSGKTEEVVAEDPALLVPRPPVVTIMGHVDHGKTSLLDFIRESNIISGESGGITQHIGAYDVDFKGKRITFLDTPGHEAFTAMRARGAQVTDIVVLVVAADDAVMPQTVEAINHAKAAGVPIVVAINKIDRPGANIDLIKKQLSEHDVLVEDWGGKAQCAPISAKTGQGVDRLLELILLEAEVLDLRSNPAATAKGVLIEAKLDRGRGVVGTVLIQKGVLRVGDPFLAGAYHGRVRAMFDERNIPVKEATISMPIQVLGFTGVPQAGDQLVVVESEQEARDVALKRQQLKREQSFRQIRRLTLDQISKRIAEGEVKELSVIVKADVDGSAQALSDELMKLKTEAVSVHIIHKGVGDITESDVLLAEASQAVIIGFHVLATVKARELAKGEDVDIRLYKVIYDVVNDIKLALAGLLEPIFNEEVIGTVEVRNLFRASKVGVIAGCYVLTGKIARNSSVRVLRGNKPVHEGKISSLKRFKDDAREVLAGFECGITMDGFDDLQVGDTLEAFQIVETARTL
jgi:translation initiation factor IF-2